MPLSQEHISFRTPFGANLVGAGAVFRVWAPAARAVYLITGELGQARATGYAPNERDLMVRRDDGTWTGFAPGIGERARYLFYVVGEGSRGLKRDPFARQLSIDPAFPDSDCLVGDPGSYPWHDDNFRPPAFNDFIIYQLHVGTFYGVDSHGQDRREQVARFLDVIERIDYLRDLGVNAIQLLPIQEFPWDNSLGYNNLDFFSPEMAYQVEDPAELERHLTIVNKLLANHGQPAFGAHQLASGQNQLKALVDLCHLNGIALIFDLVYNHAGGGFDDHSLWFLDRRRNESNNDSLYFTDQGWAGGLIFAYWNPGVRQFLIDNATIFLHEYHIDGTRYDEVSVIDNHGGWSFCQDLSNTVRYAKPQAIQIAEYWNQTRELAVLPPPRGLGFDAALTDGLREALRGIARQAAGGRDVAVSLETVRDSLYPPVGFPSGWRAVQCLENHDLVYAGREAHERQPRVAALCDPGNSRSWYARSRARVVTALLFTAPGIPMLFMGQEMLEDKNWSDNPRQFAGTLIWWDGLRQDRAMREHHAFTRDLIALRRRQPALRSEAINVYHVDDGNRVLAFHRWLEGAGRDVIVIASLNEAVLYHYSIGFPGEGRWFEVFNSDLYDHLPNPLVSGNAGSIMADGPPQHGFSASAVITIPANGVLVCARQPS